jgi:signal transduction histidine kinase/CheY-like chemotaxis protein/pSer/pThr/pTyr-binding forkhead associated (FHA) protein
MSYPKCNEIIIYPAVDLLDPFEERRPSRPTMPAYFVCLSDRQPVRVQPSEPWFRIGRGPDQDLVLDDSTVSRSHAVLFWRGGRLAVQDQGSRHGTFLNGERLAGERGLQDGDRIRVGEVELRLVARDLGAGDGLAAEVEDTLALPVDQLRGWAWGGPGADGLPGWRGALDLLYETSLGMVRDLPPEPFLVEMLERLTGFLGADHGTVLLRNEHGELKVLASRARGPVEAGPPDLAPGTLAAALDRKHALLLKETRADHPGSGTAGETTTASVMAVPLEHGGQVLGLFHFSASHERPPFAEDDLRLVVALGNLAAARLSQHRLAESLRQAQKLQSLGSLAGGVAHDMNNVLGAILNLATVALDQEPAGSGQRRNLVTIVRACERGAAMVKGLLAFARQDLAVRRPVDLNALVGETAALLERTTLARIHLAMDLEDGLRPVEGDPAALSHALVNLCVNAVDAMPEGGDLTLRTRNEGAGTVLLQVADTGRGMAPEVLEKAMDPFFTTKPQGQGTGLGLSLVYGTVKAHLGDIRIHSRPGRGTQVAIRLPASGAADPAPAPPEARPRAARSLRVLVVDDDELIRESTARLLEVVGHRPAVAEGGPEALRRLGEGLEPDVVLLDLNMPGMGGAEALRGIRALRPELPVLLVTGRVDQEAMDLVQGSAGVRLLAKPYSLADLERALAD